MDDLIELETLSEEIAALVGLYTDAQREDGLLWLRMSKRLRVAVEAVGTQYRALCFGGHGGSGPHGGVSRGTRETDDLVTEQGGGALLGASYPHGDSRGAQFSPAMGRPARPDGDGSLQSEVFE